MTNEQRKKFEVLANRLSPENLHCDGEATMQEAEAEERRCNKQWAALEKELGRKVTEEEIWEHVYEEAT